MVELKSYCPPAPAATIYWSDIGIPAHGAELYQCVQQGLEYAVLSRMASISGFSVQTLAAITGLSAYALHRARQCGRWSSMQSDRLIRTARVLHAAQALFGGDWGLARHWLITPQWALKDQRPLDCLLTEVESRVVLDLIGQIGHGIAI